MPQNELAHLFTFRVSNGLPNSQFEMVPNRRRAAKKLISFVKQGHPVEGMIVQQKVGKEWKGDPEAFDLMHRIAEKEANKAPQKIGNTLTPKKAAGRLATAARLASTADAITEDHVRAIESAYNDLMEVTGYVPAETTEPAEPSDPEDEEFEDEDEEDEEE